MPDSHSQRAKEVKGYSLALLAAVCWATGGLTAKWLFTAPSAATGSWPVEPLGIAIDPTVLSGVRALTAFVILFVYLMIARRDALRIDTKDIPFFVVFGVLGLALVHLSYFQTIQLTNVATAILLEYLAPILVLVVSVLFRWQRLTWSLPAGVILSVAGSALVVGVGSRGLSIPPAGLAWGLASAVFFAFYSLQGSVAAKRFSPFTTLVYGLGFAALFWLIVLGPQRILSVYADPRAAAAVVFVAVVSTVIPFGAFLVALRYIPPTNATITSTFEPFLAGLGAYFLFGETMTVSQLVGGLLVVAAIAVVQMPQRPQAPEATMPWQD